MKFDHASSDTTDEMISKNAGDTKDEKFVGVKSYVLKVNVFHKWKACLKKLRNRIRDRIFPLQMWSRISYKPLQKLHLTAHNLLLC